MDSIETPYEEETQFIDCTICEKSLRGDTLYKIHLTTAGHLKKEDSLVAAGLAVRQHILPNFKNISHYLNYLNLDEPIIGLNCLDEVPNHDPQSGPTYTCRLCNQTAVLVEMACHVIGRKHRQKYVEVNRPDLVTWDNQTIRTQGGKIMRAKAEIIERQNGRGTPKSLVRTGTEGQSNIPQVYPGQRENRDRNIPGPMQNVPPLLPELKDFGNRKKPLGHLNSPSFYPDELNRNRRFPVENTHSRDHAGDELQRGEYKEGFKYREDYIKPQYQSPLQEAYVDNPQRRELLEQRDGSRYNYREQMSHGQVQDQNPAEAPPYKRHYPENDPIDEIYPEGDGRGQLYSHGYQPSQPVYLERDERRWSVERDSGRHDNMNRARWQETSKPEAKRRNLSTPLESDQSRDHMFQIIKDYHHEMREPYPDEVLGNPGPSRAPTSQRQVTVTPSMSNIPEPFRLFLKGGVNYEGHRKRKSRFSDATPEEIHMTKEMFSHGYGPPYRQSGGNQPAGVPLRPDISATQSLDSYGKPQNPLFIENYQREGSNSEGVFDMLKNIEIENAQEAEYLKTKLCSLLKDFKAIKQEKATLPRQHQYERFQRQDSDLRCPEDHDNNSQRRGWRQREHLPEEYHQEYQNPVHREPRQPSRGRFKDEPLGYPGRFQEPMHPRDHQRGAEAFFDSRSSGPPPHMEQGTRMQSGSSYSNNLDKFTSALLEFVARK